MRRGIALFAVAFVIGGTVAASRLPARVTSARPTPAPGATLFDFELPATPRPSYDPGFPAPPTEPASGPAATQPIPVNDRPAFVASRAEQMQTKLHPDLLSSARAYARDLEVPNVDGALPIHAVAKTSGADLLHELQGLGLVDGQATTHTVSGRLPLANVPALSNVASLGYARPQWAVRHVGAVDSQGDDAIRADLARAKYKLTGKGVTVGVLSDSFDCLETAVEDVASGDIPDDVKVVKEDDCMFGTDEGRGMAQIIADVAPEADLMFHTVMGGPLEMAKAIEKLTAAGADVIVDDVGYFDDPWLQDGVAAQAVDAARAKGVAYFSSAGNSGDASYEAPWDDSGIEGFVPDSRVHDFDPGPDVDPLQRITIAPGAVSVIELQWSDNFKTHAPDGPAPKTDLNMVAVTDKEIVGLSLMPNLQTLEPFEVMLIANPLSTPMKVDLIIEKDEGVDPKYLKWVEWDDFARIDEYANEIGATIKGHNGAAGAISVGAANYRQTPEFGTKPPVVNKYSSRGGATMLLDKNGKALSQAFKRRKPEVVGPDGANTTFFGRDSGADDDKFPNFAGTSASAPHAAGVAALLFEKLPKASPADICNALTATTVEMDRKGFDFATGHGLVDARAAAEWLTKVGRDGPCDLAPIPVDLRFPEPEPDPTPRPEPEPAVTPAPVPVAPPAPVEPPTPPPIPARPMVFVEQSDVLAGGFFQLSGWFMPRNSSFTIGLEGQRAIGSATSDGSGRFYANVQVPQDIPPAKYVVTASGGIGTVKSAKRLTVHQAQTVVAGVSVTPPPIEAAGWLDPRTVLLLVAMVAGIAGAVVLSRSSRWS